MHSIRTYLFSSCKFVPLNNISPIPYPPSLDPDRHHSTLCFHEFGFLIFCIKWYHTVFVFHCLIYLNVLKFHSWCHECQDFRLSHGWILFHCIHTRYLLYSFIHLMDTLVVLISWLLWIMLLWTWVCANTNTSLKYGFQFL